MRQRYDTYKDSGVQWLGEIPGHWGCVPFKRVATVKSNLVHPNDYLELPQISPDCIEKNSGRLLSWKTVADSNVESDNHLFYKGHIIYSKIRPLLNKVIIAPFDGLCSADMYPIETTTNTKYMQYYMLSNLFLSEVRNVTRDRVKMPKINREELGQIRIIVPPLSEQRSIVSFLDAKCGKIDEWVTKKQKEVEHLQELKQRVIADAVTRGLNPHVKMKATNIPWLKEIPEHWENKRLAAMFTDDIETNKDFQYKRAFKFNYGCLVPKNEIGDPEEYRDVYVKYSIVNTGDILINGLNLNYDFISQRVACAPSDGIITSAYVVCHPRPNVNYDYYTYLFKAMDSMKLFHGMGTGIRLTLSFKELKKQILPVPPIEEQRAIVMFINTKTSKIDKLIANITKEIECIKEYKQRLISDVVTGQIKVC